MKRNTNIMRDALFIAITSAMTLSGAALAQTSGGG